ncbi:hypothetical protein PUNSTDRAFT_53883 [Punctularia strigosozonata HHB-11173 SS5]|uniref:uncharacterized protein n=1 Tax=Punctularia strigosozonata (strain HHB-11173) TaxID=741275 RepID=UPI0004416889|nr:uncharacterized protein PUNSTDRAFT_53883 [Punctularia strigosozonata HHB-11173 SS5]EIN06422.1 hypothetical protein PUNSTDRAFT_53883 [Punctularia strigosozonata HHB-11173 SS5]
MKRSMDSVGGPDAKKASIQQAAAFASSSPANAFGANQLYSTPSLSINTNMSPNAAAGQQMSPNAAAAAFLQSQQQQAAQQQLQTPVSGNGVNPYASLGAYNMLGMGMPGMMGFYGGQLGNFGQNANGRPGLPSLNIPAATTYQAQAAGALSAALSATAANATNRTVYVGNLPPTASVDELLNLVHFGPLENIRVLPEKSCVFLSFLDGATAAAFHADATIKKLALHGQELKIGWGKPSPVPQQVALAISQSNASRNVYLGGLDEAMTEEQLRDDLSRFGLIDQVKIVRDKNIGFVHFLSIATANKVVNTLPTEPAWAGKRVNYGKDRCAYIPKSQQAAAQAAQVAAAQSLVAHSAMTPASANPFNSPFSPFGAPFSPADAGAQGLNRTVYLGNIHPETQTEDLCNAIRGGVLQSIRYMQDKHIAFVTFVDPAAAFTFFQVASYQGLTLNNRRLKIGWGKNSGPLPPSLALAVHSGATRNVYIGNIEDFDTYNEEKLKRDFGEYGEIELVNFLKEKNCAFVNFTNVANAIKAIEGVKTKPDYANLRISHGKDRCANPPRQGPQGGGGTRRSASGQNSAVSPNGFANATVGGQPDADSDAVVLGEDIKADVEPITPEPVSAVVDVKPEEAL